MGRKPTPKQKKLAKLMPKIVAGDLTQQEGMIKAGYAKTSAREQSEILGSLGNQKALQKALREAGMDEAYIGQEIASDTQKLQPGKTKLDYLKTGAKLLDAVPSDKLDQRFPEGPLQINIVNFKD